MMRSFNILLPTQGLVVTIFLLVISFHNIYDYTESIIIYNIYMIILKV